MSDGAYEHWVLIHGIVPSALGTTLLKGVYAYGSLHREESHNDHIWNRSLKKRQHFISLNY